MERKKKSQQLAEEGDRHSPKCQSEVMHAAKTPIQDWRSEQCEKMCTKDQNLKPRVAL